MQEDVVLRRRKKEASGPEKSHLDELKNVYAPPNAIRIKSRSVRRSKHVTYTMVKRCMRICSHEI
jgi:hypothetical protein